LNIGPGDEVTGTSADKDNHVVQPKLDTDEKNDALEEVICDLILGT
jgi:hypothetical protein